MNDTILLKIENVSMTFDGLTALDNLSFNLSKGEIFGIIGTNGAGKTTLFNIISGFYRPKYGKIIFNGNNIIGMQPDKIALLGIARTFQNIRIINTLSVLDNVLLCFKNHKGENLMKVFYIKRAVQKQENILRKEAMHLLDKFGFADKANEPAGNLSYGQKKILNIICCMAMDAKLFLFDEPVAGIGFNFIEKILNIIKELASKGKSILLIEHNIDAVVKTCNQIAFLNAGKKISQGTSEHILNDPAVIEHYIS